MTNPSAGENHCGHRLVVADAGPLIHLDELDCLGLLADFSEVKVPEAVWREVSHHRPQALCRTDIPLCRCASSLSAQVVALGRLYTLHDGERESLSVCLKNPGAVLLTDDTAARLAAKSLSIQVHGSIGLLMRSLRRRQLDKAEVLLLLERLPTVTSLHIRPSLLKEFIQQVNDWPMKTP